MFNITVIMQNISGLSDETSVWYSKPTNPGRYTYAVAVPIITCLGAVFNVINMIIYARPRMCSSIYTYLLAISFCDCITCLLIMFSAMARSIFYTSYVFALFDIFIHLPMAGFVCGISNLVMVSMALDRLIYLKCIVPRGPPKFCRTSVARKIIVMAAIVSALINLPYFFIHRICMDGTLETTEFFESLYYQVHNWVRFMIMGLFPGIFLMIGNGILINIIRKWSKCKLFVKALNANSCNRAHDQRRLTITLVAVVFLFIIGELPTYFASRQSAITLLYHGDISLTENEDLEIFRIVATVLNSIHVSFNIILYASLNPAYLLEFIDFLQRITCTEKPIQKPICDLERGTSDVNTTEKCKQLNR